MTQRPPRPRPRPGYPSAPSAEAARRELRRARKQKSRKRQAIRTVVALAVALALGFAAHHFCFRLVVAQGAGMSPLIEGGSVVLCVRQSLLDALRGIVPESVRHPGRGSLVLIDYGADAESPARGTLLIRRVAAVGGDTLDLAGDKLIRNMTDVMCDAGSTDLVYPVTVPRGALFVTGENSVSIDSRLRAFSEVSEADVTGRPVMALWPAFAIGPLS